MKKKIARILGVGLTLVMVLSLTVALAPVVSADPDENEWSKFTIPEQGSDGDWVLANYFYEYDTGAWTDDDRIGPLAMSIDGTLYCQAYGLDVGPDRPALIEGANSFLFKSEDGGYTWDDVGKVKGDDRVIVDIACSTTDADVLYYATSTEVYKSDDAGSSFELVGEIPGIVDTTENIIITSLDVTYYDGDYMFVVGVADTDGSEYGGIYLLDEGGRPFPGWIDQRVGGVDAGDASGFDVWDVVFSPNFEDDEQLLAVVTDENETWVTTRLGTSGWDSQIKDIELQDADINNIVADGKAWICFPSDYDSDPDSGDYNLFVGVYCGPAVDAAEGDVWLVLGDGEVSIDLDATDKNVWSLDCTGPADDAYLMVGTDVMSGTGDPDGREKIMRSTDAGSSWKSCFKEPTGCG